MVNLYSLRRTAEYGEDDIPYIVNSIIQQQLHGYIKRNTRHDYFSSHLLWAEYKTT